MPDFLEEHEQCFLFLRPELSVVSVYLTSSKRAERFVLMSFDVCFGKGLLPQEVLEGGAASDVSEVRSLQEGS